jgi:hypothetical protein
VKIGEQLPSKISAKIVFIPREFKDPNDWTLAGATAEDLLIAIKNAEALKPGPPVNYKPGDSKDEEKFYWLKLETYGQLFEQEPEQIIKGILLVGEKFGITAGSKRFKTWLLLYLAYAVASGLQFLGRETKQSKVAIFDLESSKNSLHRRLLRIQKAIRQGDFNNVRICVLRRKARRFCRALKSSDQPPTKAHFSRRN